MKTKFTIKHPLNFFTLGFVSRDKESKFQKEYLRKSLNTIRVGLALIILIVVIVDAYRVFWRKDFRNANAKVIVDGIFLFGGIIIIICSYINAESFDIVLHPFIGFGIFLYCLFDVWLGKRLQSPSFLLLAIVAYFLLKVSFRFIAFYSITFLIVYQFIAVFKFSAGFLLLANDILLLNVAVSVLVGSYIYEYTLRRTFMKKEKFQLERKKLTNVKAKTKAFLGRLMPHSLVERFYTSRRSVDEKTLNVANSFAAIDIFYNSPIETTTSPSKPTTTVITVMSRDESKDKPDVNNEKQRKAIIKNNFGQTFATCPLLVCEIPNFEALCTASNINTGSSQVLQQVLDLWSIFEELIQYDKLYEGIVPVKILRDKFIVAPILKITQSDLTPSNSDQSDLTTLTGLAKIMIDISQNDSKIPIKICLTCGPTSTGVIGFSKFSFDVWGPSYEQNLDILSKINGGEIAASEEVCNIVCNNFQISTRIQVIKFGVIGESENGVSPPKERFTNEARIPQRLRKSKSEESYVVSPTMKALEEVEDDTKPFCNCSFTFSSLWYRKKKTEIDREISREIKFKGRKRWRLDLGGSFRKQFILEYEKKQAKPLRLYFIVIVWSVCILGPAQDISTLDSLEDAIPFLFVRYAVLTPGLLFLLLPTLIPRYFNKLYSWIQLLWAIFVILLGIVDVALTATVSSSEGRDLFTSRFVGIFIMAFTLFRLRFMYLLATCCALLSSLNIAFIIYYVIKQKLITDIWEALFLSLIAILMCCKASYSLEKHAKQNFLMKRLVDAEQKKILAEGQYSSNLISNVFPASLAENQILQLAVVPGQIFCKTTNLVPNCTTMFVHLDIKGFNNISGETAAYILNSLCCGFENLARNYETDYFKQTVNSFIFYSGTEKNIENAIPADNAIKIASIATDLLKLDPLTLVEEKYASYLQGMEMKIGIATGNLMVSVVGSSFLVNEVWGESRTQAEELCKIASSNEILTTEESRFFLSTKQFLFQTKSGNYSFPSKIYSLTGKIYNSNESGMKLFGAM